MGKWLAAAGLNGLCGVAFGALASHGSAHGAAELIGAEATEWVRIGAQYQLWHGAALLALAAGPIGSSRIRNWVGSCFCFGALLFSSSLYALALLDWHWVVFVTPFGGLMMLAGWVVLLGFGLKSWRQGQ